MRDIEDRIQEEYDKVEVPDYMFDTSRVFKRVKEEKKDDKKWIISIAASIVAVLLIAVTLIFIMPNILKDDEVNVEEKGNNKEVVDSIILINETNYQGGKEKNIFATIKINNTILYQIINNIPYTKVKAQVLNSYLGNLSEEVEIYVPGGIFSIKEIKENVKYDQIDDISSFNDGDKVKVTYYNEIYIPMAEEGKTYITTLYENDGKYFVNMNAKYGFKEYDPATNIVKDDMGDEQLDINKYLESINP